jgi:hypothetical protein
VLENLKNLMSSVPSHSTLKNSAETVRNKIVQKIRKKVKVIGNAAVKSLTENNIDNVEPLLIKLKQIETGLKHVPGLLTESYYLKIVNELQLRVTKQAVELRKKLESDSPNLDVLADDLLALKAITLKISCSELHAHVHKEIYNILNCLSGKKGFDFYHFGCSAKIVDRKQYRQCRTPTY